MKSIGYSYLGSEYRFDFLNGSIKVPDSPGIKVISTGCGSGKTTAIKEMIKVHFPDGIVYVANTIRECNEMYDWIMDNAIGSVSKGADGKEVTLNESDVISVHNEPRIDPLTGAINNGVNLHLWNNHPEKIANKRVIICTSHKLLNENPELIIGYNLNKISAFDLDLYSRIDYRIVSKGSDLLSMDYEVSRPRKLVIIDELPRCSVLKKSYTSTTIKSLAMDKELDVIYTGKLDENGFPEYRTKLYFKREGSYIKMKAVYNELERLDKALLISKSDSVPAELRKEMILSSLYRNYELYANSDEDIINVTCNINNLINNYSSILLFDGTGDLLYPNVDETKFNIKLYNIEDKYSSKIDIYKIHNNISSRTVKGRIDTQKEIEIKQSIEDNITEIIDNVFNNEKTNKILIVSWMNIKSEVAFNKSINEFSSIVLNEDFKLTEYIKDRLIGRVNKEFDVIHYMSGLDKATNKYRDYDTVVFLGKFQVPNSAIKEINEDLGCSTDQRNYTLHQLAQAICRTQIRKHNSDDLVNVYFTDDWDESVVKDIYKYITEDKIHQSNISVSDTTLSFIKPKWRGVIDRLGTYDPKLLDAVKFGKKYSLEMSLDIIYDLIPMSRKEACKYNSLVRYLNSIGINLIILTTWGKNQFS